MRTAMNITLKERLMPSLFFRCTWVYCSALDGICAKNGAFPMDVIGLITVSVLKGLSYLYHNHKIVHRGTPQSHPTFRRNKQKKQQRVCVCVGSLWHFGLELTHPTLYPLAFFASRTSRSQAFQHSYQLDRHGQDLRFRSFRTAGQLDRQHVCGHKQLHVGTFS